MRTFVNTSRCHGYGVKPKTYSIAEVNSLSADSTGISIRSRSRIHRLRVVLCCVVLCVDTSEFLAFEARIHRSDLFSYPLSGLISRLPLHIAFHGKLLRSQ